VDVQQQPGEPSALRTTSGVQLVDNASLPHAVLRIHQLEDIQAPLCSNSHHSACCSAVRALPLSSPAEPDCPASPSTYSHAEEDFGPWVDQNHQQIRGTSVALDPPSAVATRALRMPSLGIGADGHSSLGHSSLTATHSHMEEDFGPWVEQDRGTFVASDAASEPAAGTALADTLVPTHHAATPATWSGGAAASGGEGAGGAGGEGAGIAQNFALHEHDEADAALAQHLAEQDAAFSRQLTGQDSLIAAQERLRQDDALNADALFARSLAWEEQDEANSRAAEAGTATATSQMRKYHQGQKADGKARAAITRLPARCPLETDTYVVDTAAPDTPADDAAGASLTKSTAESTTESAASAAFSHKSSKNVHVEKRVCERASRTYDKYIYMYVDACTYSYL